MLFCRSLSWGIARPWRSKRSPTTTTLRRWRSWGRGGPLPRSSGTTSTSSCTTSRRSSSSTTSHGNPKTWTQCESLSTLWFKFNHQWNLPRSRLLKPLLMGWSDPRGPWEYIWFLIVKNTTEDRQTLAIYGKRTIAFLSSYFCSIYPYSFAHNLIFIIPSHTPEP